MSINWNNIRPLENSQNEAFEELVCQLARKEEILNKKIFIRKGKPDAGVECFWILNNSEEFAWQAKFFTSSLDENQWVQIDKSVTTVLEKHPNLRKYYIAIPNDPSDARINGQTSMLDKWNNRVIKWESWAATKGLTVEFIPWWSSDLIGKLQRPENVGLTYFWFNKEEFTDEWFKEQTELSIIDLGKRYTPKINVKLKIVQIFNGISRDNNFKIQIEDLVDDLLIKGKKIITEVEELESFSLDIQNGLEKIYSLIHKLDFKGIEKIPVEEFLHLLNEMNEIVNHIKKYYLEEEDKRETKSNDERYYKKYRSQINYIRDFESSAEEFIIFLEGITVKLANSPFLLLEGDAGIGKSHLLADIINTRNENNFLSLFFLGQHFVTDEDPWTQIFKKNDINCSVNEFLGALNSKAQISGQRIIIFIDAINEGRGKYFWNKNIKSFLAKIKKYEWLGVVLSIRTSYSNLIFPKDEIKENEIIRYTHYGFRNQEYEATKLFFNNYGIELPKIPLLHPEFQNPLFLLLFCEGLSKVGYTKIPDGLQGITAIINFFVNSTNDILSKPTRLDYSKSINVVKKAIEAIINYKIENHLKYVSYEQAFTIIINISKSFEIRRGLLDELISEGIFSKNLFWNSGNQYEEGIYLAYERFEDHLIANFIIDKNPRLDEAFNKNGNLFYFVKDGYTCHINKGIIEAFTIQIPEKTGKEFYEYIPHLRDSGPIIESFIQSLLWRKTETVTEKLVEYVNSTVLKYKENQELFWDTIISVTSIPDYYFNAYWLHKKLMKFSLSDRDAWWTIYLKEKFHDESGVKRLIDWAWNTNDKKHISDESIKLSSITLSWLHTSTNRKLRDSATKALICLLENRINVLIELLKEFEDVNDPYVYERLFAVAYGCAVRTEQRDKLIDLSRYIYETIFKDKKEIYPHILLRDYARGVIEYTNYLEYTLGFDISIVRPPYKSIFTKQFPTNEEIDSKYKLNNKSKDFKDYYWAQNIILNSMVTEYGRGISRYGDFGRYTFQSALRTWNIDTNLLSNLAVKWIFEKYGYDKDKHGKFDRNINSGKWPEDATHERIGKKYQWIVLYEMLARVSDNHIKYADWSYEKEKEVYQGSWEPYVRDIDPTMTIHETGNYNEDVPEEFWWSQEKYQSDYFDNNEWIKFDKDLPCPKNLINVRDESGEEWLILEGYPEWAEPKKIGDEKWSGAHKRMWYHLRSYLVSEDKFENIKEWALKQDFMGRWMPESHSRYEIFSREYYWSPAYKYFNDESNGVMEQSEIYDPLTGELIGSVTLTTNNFLWEEEFDKSKEDKISFLKPSNHIYKNMKLIFSKNEGEFVDDTGNIICFDPSVYFNTKSYLLIKKEPFINYLRENKLKILWTVLGEKNIIGGLSSLGDFHGRLEISGAYYLNDNNAVEGKVSIKKD